MTSLHLTSADDFHFLRDPEVSNLRGGYGDDHMFAMVNPYGPARANMNGGAGNDFMSWGIPNPLAPLPKLMTMYGDERFGPQGDDYFAVGGSTATTEMRYNGRGGSDIYDGHGGHYQRPAEIVNFNVKKDHANMAGQSFTLDAFEFEYANARPDGRVNIDVSELTIRGHDVNPITDGQLFHLQRNPDRVQGTELAEDGHRDGVMFRTSVNPDWSEDQIVDWIEYRLDTGGFVWFNPDDVL